MGEGDMPGVVIVVVVEAILAAAGMSAGVIPFPLRARSDMAA